MVPIWKQRHSQRIRQMKRPFFGAVTSGQAFSVGVLEELLILIVVSLLSYKLHSPILCLAFMVAYTLHFLMHFRMCLAYQGYVPGIISATLELPIMIWLILTYWQQSQCTISEFAIYFVFAFMVMMLNLRIMHELMPHIQARMTTYTKTSSL